MTRPFHQVAYTVEDLDAAVRHWSDVLGVGPWSVWTMAPDVLSDAHYQGEEAVFGIRHALAWSGDLQVELVQPLSGPSIFADQLATSGPGLNHIGRLVEDREAERAELLAHGYRAVQGATFGASRDGRFEYFAAPDGGAVIELIHPPTERFTPDYIHPEREA